jgi:hypothetical protein
MLVEFMELLKILYDFCPKWIPNSEIYELFQTLRNISPFTHEKIIFAKIKLYEILWLLQPPQNNPVLFKICQFIAKNSVQNALKLTWLRDENIADCKKMFQQIKK